MRIATVPRDSRAAEFAAGFDGARQGVRGIGTRLRLLAILLVLGLAGCDATGSVSSFASSSDGPPAAGGSSPAASSPDDAATSPGPGSTPAGGANPARPTFPAFGFAGHLLWDTGEQASQALDMLAEDGLTVLRIDASWRNMEPEPGRYQYLEKLDLVVDGAVDRGIHLIVDVAETPPWANGGADAWTPPQRPEDYARFVGTLAERYRGRVLGWEIWNEPDLALFWKPRPSPAAYAAMVRATSAAIRAADPGARVAAAGATFGNFAFMQGLYEAGLRGAIDVMVVHPYPLTHAPDDVSDRDHSLVAVLDDAHRLMTAHGDEAMPIWVTELGWPTTGANAIPPDRQAEYMVRSVRLVRDRPWVQVLTMYTIDVRHSERHGLSRDGQRSASWVAYVRAVRNAG